MGSCLIVLACELRHDGTQQKNGRVLDRALVTYSTWKRLFHMERILGVKEFEGWLADKGYKENSARE